MTQRCGGRRAASSMPWRFLSGWESQTRANATKVVALSADKGRILGPDVEKDDTAPRILESEVGIEVPHS